MENTSKALFMAASVLTAMMLIGVFIYVFREGGKVGENFEAKQAQEQLELYNSKFATFQKRDNTILDIISVINLAVSTNEMVEYNQKFCVTVDVQVNSPEKGFCITPKFPIEKNYVYIGMSSNIDTTSKKIYTYDLINKKKNELCAYNRQTLIKEGTISFGASEGIWKSGDNLSIAKKHEDGRKETIYKYAFNCTDMQYNTETGRINYMKFILIENKPENDGSKDALKRIERYDTLYYP